MQTTRRRRPLPVLATFLAGLLSTSAPRPTGRAAEPTAKPSGPSFSAEHVEFFENKIRPVLAAKCYACHSAEAKALRGGLLLDSREGLLRGGDSGPAVVVGKPDDSLLLQALRFEGFEMPPEGKLPATTIDDFARWIAIGLPDPRTAKSVPTKKTFDLAAGRRFWSFRPIADPRPPQVGDAAWPAADLDRFVLAALEAKRLAPAAEAAPAVLGRRLYFDLIGLPPTPEQLAAFVDACSRQGFEPAYRALVDELLARPQFGERWGRRWLDVARFAESSGGGRSVVFKDAWRYRDYVIRAFNQDKPFDRFLTEQIAGDLLEHASADVETDCLVATAYLVLGANNYEEQDKRLLEMDVTDEQIDAVGRGLLGMTLACARCHDHKFDPVPTADYYALAGIFRGTTTLIHENVSRGTKRNRQMHRP